MTAVDIVSTWLCPICGKTARTIGELNRAHPETSSECPGPRAWGYEPVECFAVPKSEIRHGQFYDMNGDWFVDGDPPSDDDTPQPCWVIVNPMEWKP